jgi:hypothetical protein
MVFSGESGGEWLSRLSGVSAAHFAPPKSNVGA